MGEQKTISPGTRTTEFSRLSALEHFALNTVLNLTGVSKEGLMNKVRVRKFVSARQVFSAYMITHLNYTYQAVGRLLGGRNHSTIINLVRNHPGDYNYLPEYRSLYDEFAEEMDEFIRENGYLSITRVAEKIGQNDIPKTPTLRFAMRCIKAS